MTHCVGLCGSNKWVPSWQQARLPVFWFQPSSKSAPHFASASWASIWSALTQAFCPERRQLRSSFVDCYSSSDTWTDSLCTLIHPLSFICMCGFVILLGGKSTWYCKTQFASNLMTFSQDVVVTEVYLIGSLVEFSESKSAEMQRRQSVICEVKGWKKRTHPTFSNHFRFPDGTTRANSSPSLPAYDQKEIFSRLRD